MSGYNDLLIAYSEIDHQINKLFINIREDLQKVVCQYNVIIFVMLWIGVITKLPNSEQSYKGKVKTHNYINRQNQSTTGKLWKP
jgi:hypothetical protein